MDLRATLLALTILAAPVAAVAQPGATAAANCNGLSVAGERETAGGRAAVIARCEPVANDPSRSAQDRMNAFIALGVTVQNDEAARGQRYFDQAIAVSQGSPAPGLYTLRGVTFIAQEKWQEALADFNRAIELNARDFIALQRRAAVQVELGRKLEAIADYSRALEISPTVKSFAQRGMLFIDARDYEAAIADFDRAIAMEPNTANLHVRRGFAYALKGDLGAAERDADRALQLSPGDRGATAVKSAVADARARAAASPPAAAKK